MEDLIRLDKSNMYDYFRQTKEFIFIDEIEIIPVKSAIGTKYISGEEWYFKHHFPDNPIMPGVFQMEAMMQTAGLIINTMPEKKDLSVLFHSAKNISVTAMIIPSTTIIAQVDLISYKRGIAKFNGKVFDNTKITSTMEFTLIVPDEIIKIN